MDFQLRQRGCEEQGRYRGAAAAFFRPGRYLFCLCFFPLESTRFQQSCQDDHGLAFDQRPADLHSIHQRTMMRGRGSFLGVF